MHAHNGMPIFLVYPAAHMMAQLIFQRFSAKSIEGNYT